MLFKCSNISVTHQSFGRSKFSRVGSARNFSSSRSLWAKKIIAFPSISTSTLGFNLDKAAEVGTQCIKDFLSKNSDPELQLYLVDNKPDSIVLKTFKEKYGNGDKRFDVLESDISALKTTSNIEAQVIVNTTPLRFTKLGSSINKAINAAAGDCLLEKTLELHPKQTLVGHIYPVPIANESPLNRNEGVKYVIHVYGPNMNPNRPNFLYDNYVNGCFLLKKCYDSIFDKFGELSKENFSEDVVYRKTNKAKRINNWKGKWADALLEIIRRPELHRSSFYDPSTPDDIVTREYVVIKDKYPKSKVHLLVLPTEFLPNYSFLEDKHIPLLERMKAEGEKIIAEIQKTEPNLTFRMGFHAVPSMRQVHLHIISQDFSTAFMKQKKHWNTFNTKFFIEVDEFIDMLKKNGTMELDENYYLEETKKPITYRGLPVSSIPKIKEQMQEDEEPANSTTSSSLY